MDIVNDKDEDNELECGVVCMSGKSSIALPVLPTVDCLRQHGTALGSRESIAFYVLLHC